MLIVVSVTLFCQFPMLYYGLEKKNFKVVFKNQEYENLILNLRLFLSGAMSFE